MSKPFAGVRILDFTRYLAGPYGTYQLALLGADVVKIESHEGDDTRNQLADRVWAERKMAPSFLAVNGNKRSITLDLRMPEAVEVVKKLAATADVVWENFRGGVMDRLGLGYAVLSAVNPRLIYCAVSGFGQTGPERTTAALAFIPGTVSEYTVAGIEPRQIGNGSVSRKPTASRFRARGGYLVLAVLTEKQFASLMKTLGRPDALADPRFKDWPARTANEPALRAIIEEALAADDPKSWEARLTTADVPCGSIWKIDEIVKHPQLEHRDVLQTIDSRYGPMRLVGAGFRLEHGSPGLDREPPILGEHTDEILREAGYRPEDIERLRRDAVI